MVRPGLLLVDGNPHSAEPFMNTLGTEYDVHRVADADGALTFLKQHNPPVVLLTVAAASAEDPEHGVRLIRDIAEYAADAKVIVRLEDGERDLAVRAIGYGAYDVMFDPVDIALLRSVLRRACWVSELDRARQTLHRDGDEEVPGMLGNSASIRRIYQAISKVSDTDVPVLITGESGTGKEITAQAIHDRSPRKNGPFVPINCGAIPENLLEAELFGYERGAFTGAVQQKKGKVEYAQNGTLFLDEVGELPFGLQVKLLRFLQDRTFERVGGRQSMEINVRIMAATNVDLKKAIEDGTFREDLYYRLGVVNIHLPPLRDREEDVLILAMAFLRQATDQHRKRVTGFTKPAIHAMKTYPWPGNVRELYNKIRRAVVMAEGSNLTPEDMDLPYDRDTPPPPISLRAARQRIEADVIAQAFMLHRGNLRRAAMELGVSRPTLYRLLRQYGLSEKVRQAC